LKLEGAPGQDTPVGNGQRGDKDQQQKEARRTKVSVNTSRLHLVFGLLLGVSFILRASAAGIDPFYVVRIASGKEAFNAGRFQEAADEFRIGCFGLLDRPPALLECTARLALAQKGAGRIADVEETLRRFREIETRFGVWKQVDLELPVRTSFVKLVKESKGFETLAATLSVPSAQPSPAMARTAPAPLQAPATVATQRREPSPAPSPLVAVPVERAPPEQALSQADVQKLLQKKSFDKALAASLVLLERDPSSREVRKMVLESSVLSKSFETGERQISQLEPFRDGEEGSMFYAAVSLFETGSVEKARRLMEKCVPKLVSSPFLEYYKKRILG